MSAIESRNIGTAPRHLVWDVPVRLFHWTVVALVTVAWISGEAEGALFVVHELAGYGLLVALVFRIAWGFVGSRHARFGDFVRPFGEIREHLRGLLRLDPAPTSGHNPLGGLMALALMAVLLATVGSGLFAWDDGVGGPFAGAVGAGIGDALSELHEGLAVAVLVLAGVHVAGVLVQSLLGHENLVRAMLTGRKRVFGSEADEPDGAGIAPAWRAALALAAACALVWVLVAA